MSLPIEGDKWVEAQVSERAAMQRREREQTEKTSTTIAFAVANPSSEPKSKDRNRSEYLYEKVDTIGRRRGNREKREQGRKIGGEKKQQIDRSGD